MLVIAYHFPPAGGRGAAGSLRALKFARHLPGFGWTPVVMTVRERDYPENTTIDESLGGFVAEDLRVERTPVLQLITPLLRMKNRVRRLFTAERSSPSSVQNVRPAPDATPGTYQRLKDGITDLFKIPDEVSGWLLPAAWRGWRLLRSERADVILATGRPWTSLVVGAILKKVSGRPLIVDFRDPWVSNPFRSEPSRFKDWAEHKLERWVVRSADLLIANTDNLRDEFLERYPDDLRGRCISILNGFDAEEFSSIELAPDDAAARGVFRVMHSGVLYGKRDPKSFIDALRLLSEDGRIAAGNFQCDLLGDIKLHYDLEDYIREAGVDDLVTIRGEVSYRQSIEAVASCDGALLLQPGTATQIPSKVFEYIGLGKQILTIAPLESAVSELITENGLGVVADADNVEAVASMIMQSMANWREGSGQGELDPDVKATFDVRNSVRQLAIGADGLLAEDAVSTSADETQ